MVGVVGFGGVVGFFGFLLALDVGGGEVSVAGRINEQSSKKRANDFYVTSRSVL